MIQDEDGVASFGAFTQDKKIYYYEVRFGGGGRGGGSATEGGYNWQEPPEAFNGQGSPGSKHFGLMSVASLDVRRGIWGDFLTLCACV